jgi:hypothetical protein
VSHDLEVVSSDLKKAHISSEERTEAMSNIAAMKTTEGAPPEGSRPAYGCSERTTSTT